MSLTRPLGDRQPETYRLQSALRLSLRVLLTWAGLAVVLLIGGRVLLTAMLPLFNVFIDLMQPDFVPSLEIARDADGWVVRLRPLIAKAIAVGPGTIIPPGTRLDWFSTSLDHTLVPILLFFTALLSWPTTSAREWGLRVLTGLPALLVVLLLSAPILLIGRVQMWLTELAVRNGAPFHEPAWVTFMIFMESGGRWLLPLVAAVACISAGRTLSGVSPSHPTQANAKPSAPRSLPPVFPPAPSWSADDVRRQDA
jgi:hypothetical protein